ncbi:MAG: hypothetical protein HC929_23675 [Leptolyngbyaceae cyanobacterium SM2_5_2]|nr:hypothetical protein [Leptolyngbyaceae cyanobacterium SM2_5_2]
METLFILFVIGIFIYLNSPKKKDPPKDVWCEMGKAIGDALKTLGKPDDKKDDKKGSSPPPFMTIFGFAVVITLITNPTLLEPLLRLSDRQLAPLEPEPNLDLNFDPFVQNPFPDVEVAAQNSTLEEPGQLVVITNSAVIRASATEASSALSEVPFGTALDINDDVFNQLSQIEKDAILEGQGWVPVLLPGSSSGGFINGSEARQVVTPS